MAKKLPVHPCAEILPMMQEDELKALAESIKADGQIHAIVLGEWKDDEGEKVEGLIDGRNRLRACEIAGVEPRFEKLNGQDPVAFIAAVNLGRRNLTGGQKAMAYAMMYPEAKKGGDRKSSSRIELDSRVPKGRLSVARFVLSVSVELAKAVMSGSLSLEDAQRDAKELQRALTSDEAKLAELRNHRPDLAEIVDRGGKVSEQYAAYEKGKEEARLKEANKRETLIRMTEAVCLGLDAWASKEFAQAVEERLQDREFKKQIGERAKMLTSANIKQAAANLSKIYAKG